MTSPTIIIVDDDVEYAETLRDRVRQVLGDRVAAVGSVDAFLKLDLGDLKCVVADYYLEDSSHGEVSSANVLPLLDLLKGEHPDVKVILHSGLAEPVDVARSNQLGIFRYIPKDRPDELIANLAALFKPTHSEEGEPPQPPSSDLLEISEARIAQQLQRIKDDYETVLRLIRSAASAGQNIASLFDGMLEGFQQRMGARGGAWFVIDKNLEAFRNSNCRPLGRPVSLPRQPRSAIGSLLWNHVIEFAKDKTEPRIVIDGSGGQGGSLTDPEPGSLPVGCLFGLHSHDDILLFFLEVPRERAAAAASAVATYVTAFGTMVDIIPLYASRSELGRVARFTDSTERGVSLVQLTGRAFLLLMALVVFASSAIAALFSLSVLTFAVLGFPDVLARGLAWEPGHYAIGIVYALELLILTITLYLLGVGISCMVEHPRLRGVPLVLRYLDNPSDMKKSLILAICTLLAVAGLKEILEANPTDELSLIAFIAKVGLLALLIGVLTHFLSTVPDRQRS